MGGASDDLKAVNISNLHFPHACLVFLVMSMSWKFLIRLVLILFFGFLTAVSVFAPVHQKRADLRLGASDRSLQEFSNLSADEINRRTLKAAAAINAAQR